MNTIPFSIVRSGKNICSRSFHIRPRSINHNLIPITFSSSVTSHIHTREHHSLQSLKYPNNNSHIFCSCAQISHFFSSSQYSSQPCLLNNSTAQLRNRFFSTNSFSKMAFTAQEFGSRNSADFRVFYSKFLFFFFAFFVFFVVFIFRL